MKNIDTIIDTETQGLDEPWDITEVPPNYLDDAYIWNKVDGQNYPFLSWQPVY